MAKSKSEIELESKLLKAWADVVYQKHLRKEAVLALNDLNCRAHSGYDFNADPDEITLKVGNVLNEQWPHFEKSATPPAIDRLASRYKKALEQILTGEISGEPNNHKDTVYVMRQIAKDALES